MVRIPRVLGLLVVGVAVVAACGRHPSGTTSATTAPSALNAFVNAFDAGAGHRRLVLLMSPT